MTYHLARVANWLQHRTVDHYPTPILRQLYLGPWSEFAVANIQILVGSDRMASSVQFAAMLGCIIGVTSIAKKLGATLRGQALAGLFTATIPIVMLEASNTQTDCVAAFWVVCAINFGLIHIGSTKPVSKVLRRAGSDREESGSSEYLRDRLGIGVLLAMSAGVAFLTKATTAVILAPFIGWIVLSQLAKPRIVGRLIILLIIIPLLINARHFYRNYTVFGQILVPESEAGWYSNTLHTPGAISSNILRNLLINTGFRGMGRFPTIATKLVRTLSKLDPSDPRITYSDTHFRFSYSRDEHDAGNPIHLLLGTIALATAIFKFKRDSPAAIYACCILCGFFLFCYQLKWQPWITRLQLPMFVIIAPLFGLLIDRIRIASLTWIIILLLFSQSFIYLLYGAPRTLVGPHTIFNTSRADQYFSKRPDLRDAYQQAAKIIGEPHSNFVALACKGDSWEYAIRSQLPAGVGIVHVGVSNLSSACPTFYNSSRPEFLIVLDDAAVPVDYAGYRRILDRPGIVLLTNPSTVP